jgi:hypothetical protein
VEARNRAAARRADRIGRAPQPPAVNTPAATAAAVDPAATAINAPTNVRVLILGQYSARISWTDASTNEEAFRVSA